MRLNKKTYNNEQERSTRGSTWKTVDVKDLFDLRGGCS